ncbi:MAG: gliding motility-associated C-terminal domain-containing protein [Bacteroidota bacterium]
MWKLYYKSYTILIMLIGCYQSLSAQRDTLFICDPGDPIQLSVGEGNFAYQWSPFRSFQNPTIPNPVVAPFEPTTYTVRRIPSITSDNLIVNPNFTLGNEGFTSDYDFVPVINIQGVYGIDVSAENLNPLFFEDCPDHTSGAGPMLVVDGSPTRNEKVWCQTIEVKEDKDYAFSAWLTSVNPNNPAALQFSINGQPLGEIFRASSQVCRWLQFYEIWNAEGATEAEICIVNQNTNPQGNDFAMDDFAFFELDEVLNDTIVVMIDALIAAQDRRVYFPNAFSPNYDGNNETFRPFLGKGVEMIESFQIFNRWGNLVFQRENCAPNDPNCAWDGRFKGKPLLPGNYVYVAQIRYADQVRELKRGSLWLMK